MKVFATAYPDSNIAESSFTVEGLGASLRLPISVGKSFAQTLSISDVFERESGDFAITVHSQDRNVCVLTKHIPIDSEFHLIGVNRDLFLGIVVHGHARNFGPRCELRCSPNDPPVTGPGCITCQKDTLTFKVCC